MGLEDKLLGWFEENGRKFPWRETNDPYRVLVAEIMLQKTSASQVLPVYKDFIKVYTGPQDLASTGIEDIEEKILSLGLHQNRAKRLKELGNKLMDDFGSKVPREKKELESLPGIGEYISSAVLCMAFGEKQWMVDSNFRRVLGRYTGNEHPGFLHALPELEDMGAEDVRKLNLAVLDYGALVCRPQHPKCDDCVLREGCEYEGVEP